jgi:hypothetical protein
MRDGTGLVQAGTTRKELTGIDLVSIGLEFGRRIDTVPNRSSLGAIALDIEPAVSLERHGSSQPPTILRIGGG